MPWECRSWREFLLLLPKYIVGRSTQYDVGRTQGEQKAYPVLSELEEHHWVNMDEQRQLQKFSWAAQFPLAPMLERNRADQSHNEGVATSKDRMEQEKREV